MTETTPPEESATTTTAREPSLFGCLIPIVALTVLFSFGTCVAVTGYLQNKHFAEFADDEPITLESETPDQAQIDLVQAKLNLLEDAAKTGTKVEVGFSPEDFNTLIASQPLLESLRQNTVIESIQNSGIVALKSQQVRKLGGGSRYLNGRFIFVPHESETNHWQLMLQDVQLPEKEVPKEFVAMFRELHMFRFDASQKRVQAVLERVAEMRLQDGMLWVVIPEK